MSLLTLFTIMILVASNLALFKACIALGRKVKHYRNLINNSDQLQVLKKYMDESPENAELMIDYIRIHKQKENLNNEKNA